MDKARAAIEKDLAKQVDRGKMEQQNATEILSRIVFSDDLAAAAQADLFIESIVEDIDVKREKFAEIDAAVNSGCIIASNTSTLGITAMQSTTGRDRHGRFIGLHFFNPATVMKLVEVIPTLTTEASVTADALAFVEAIGKIPVLVHDETGFIVNRLLTPYMLDAMRCFESGLADIAGIDTAMRLGANHPMGPLSLADYIGLDVVMAMADNLYESFGHEYMKATPVLRQLVNAEELGRKSGIGFYDYSQKPPLPNPQLDKK